MGTFFFFYWIQGHNLLVDDQYFKRGRDIKKREDQRSRGESFFSFLSIKIYVLVIPVPPDTTLKEKF